jgi:transposase
MVGRAKSLLAVAATGNFAAGARASGRKSSYGVGKLVKRFNQTGLNALETRQRVKYGQTYTVDQRQEVLTEFGRVPDREQDGTGTWSLTTLQGAVRKRAGLEKMSRYTISGILHEAGLSWQRDRTWCETGVSVRKGKHGQRVVVDPDAESKKT